LAGLSHWSSLPEFLFVVDGKECMKMRTALVTMSFAPLVVGLFPTIAAAQAATGGSIAGVVRDTTGGVLPGVTVEAASPALIEKVRTAVSNDQGQYQIVDLRLGEYAVTFTLPGFRTLRREGITLSVGFTATVNADLSVGGLEETVTVLGPSPLVDIHTTARQATFTRETMDQLPTTRNFAAMAVLIPGVTVASSGGPTTQDVGGNMGERNTTLAYHGSAGQDMPNILDGMKISNAFGTSAGNFNAWLANNGIIEEIVFDTSGFTAESETSGVRINHITRQGGNRFLGSFFGGYTNDKLQTDNLDDTQRALGLSRYVTKKIWDVNPALGGPIKRDRLWFFYSYRDWGTTDQPPGTYFDQDVNDFVYTPDLSRPGVTSMRTHANNLRLTAQLSPKHKLALYGDNQSTCICYRFIAPNLAPEAAANRKNPINQFFMGTWNWTVSNRLLIEAVETYRREVNVNPWSAEAASDGIQVTDTGRGVTFRALGLGGPWFGSFLHSGKATATYVTGSHNLKVGTQWTSMDFLYEYRIQNPDINYSYTFVNGVPTSVSYLLPGFASNNVKLGLGIFGQDQWIVNPRLTLNLGVRFDSLNGYIPEQHLPARFAGARDFPQQDNLPNWKDVSPRVGVAYDLFGTGKTALKGNAGWFIEAMGTGIASAVNPASDDTAYGRVTTLRTTRAWTDNGDFVPQENELGPSSNINFGTDKIASRYADTLITGWGARAWNWEWSAGVQHELLPGLSVDTGYFRRTRGNFRVTDNTLVRPVDYDPYCVTAPVNARLPGGGGYPVCGLYDVTPRLFGQNDNVITHASNFGKQTETFDGVDVAVNARLPGRVTFQGGTSTGRIKTNNCFVMDSPQQLLFCDVTPPFQTQFKLLGIYPLPWWGLQASATYQNLSGPEITASWAAPAASVTGLGRPLAGNLRNVTVPLVKPGTLYNERIHQMDVRATKEFTLRQGVRVQGQFDLYNLFNSNVATAQNNTYGASWQKPTAVLGGRLLKFGILVNF
jgi:carboxypeptidase family protein/TonB-dependent receptor-like protein